MLESNQYNRVGPTRYKNETSADLFSVHDGYDRDIYAKNKNDFYNRGVQATPVPKSTWNKNDSSNIFMSINNTTPRHIQRTSGNGTDRTPPPRLESQVAPKSYENRFKFSRQEAPKESSEYATPKKNLTYTRPRTDLQATPISKRDSGVEQQLRGSQRDNQFEEDRASTVSSTTGAQDLVCDQW
jgi:hypothetical protein